MTYRWRKLLRRVRDDPASLPGSLVGRALSHKTPRIGRLLGRFGAQPSFLILGVQKGGTTSLYHYLALHPRVSPALVKEVHYFDFHYGCGASWYRAHFAPQAWLTARGLQTGEASPEYLFSPDAPQRVAASLPDVKLIVMLRNPVERAYSQYQMSVRRGSETLPFAEALAREPKRLAVERQQLGAELAYARGSSHRHRSYLAKGHYAEQLEAWFRWFPREQFLILESEAFFRAPAEAYGRTLAFLGLPEHRLRDYRNLNGWGYAALEPEVRASLEAYFAPHNARLEALLERPFWRDLPQRVGRQMGAARDRQGPTLNRELWSEPG
jgi:hypothetical protein